MCSFPTWSASPTAKRDINYRPKWAARPNLIEENLQERGYMDMAELQEKINAARSERPNDYLVIHLYGMFVATKEAPAGLIIPDNTSLLLHGNTSFIARYELQNHTTYTSPALFNVCTGNKRCGLWIELRAKDNILYGNYLRGNLGRHSTGVVSFCQFGGPNLRNMIVNNTIVNHELGIDLRMGVDNIIFGNNLLNNRTAIREGGANKNNLFSQNSMRFNDKDIHVRNPADKVHLNCFTFPTAKQLSRVED